MIESVHIERFKRFRSLELDLGDLTLLTGLNGTGKSSVVHALLLYRQAARKGEGGVALNHYLDLNLGGALDVLHRGISGDSIEILVREGGDVNRLIMTVPEERALYLQVLERPDAGRHSHGLTADSPRFTYLCAERLGPRDTLGTDSVDADAIGVGVSGEFTAQVLALHRRERVRDARHAPTSEEQIGALALLERQVARWMSIILGINGLMEIEAEWIEGTTATRLRFKPPGHFSEWMRPPNLGFGVSYVLPIVVAALRTPPDGLLIVENPEAHLHPAGQSAMGEFLARMAADGVQVIVETHSDHVVNGIRRAIAEGKANLAPERVALHFFGSASEAEHTTLALSASGDLSAWPRGFFDQIERDLGAIARTRRRRPQ